jgi:hypothetical protein
MMPRGNIIRAFSEWTAFSATRSGCPIKSREKVYPLIREPKYDEILYGDQISREAFESWHETNTKAICNKNERLPIGWASKLINVYLKVRVYVAKEGRSGLIECIHPPIGNELWKGIMQEYRNEPEVINRTHIVSKIKDISDYSTYKTIIDGCRLIAQKRCCLLIEVEELWQGTIIQHRQIHNRMRHNINLNSQAIPLGLLDRSCQKIERAYNVNLPFMHRGIVISRELIGVTMEILNVEPDRTLPQNCRNAVRANTPDGLDRRIKERFNDNLRRANIISDVLANARIVEIIEMENFNTGKIVKGTQLRQEWYW